MWEKSPVYLLNAHVDPRHLIYPLPSEAGLGIHATLDLQGNIKFGPNVEWVDQIDYQVSRVVCYGRSGWLMVS